MTNASDLLRIINKKKSGASVTSLEKGIAFSPLWPLWPLWCLCVASVEKRHCVLSSMKKKRNFIEECTQFLFSERSQRQKFFFADVNPKGITVYSNSPYRVLNAVFHSSPFAIRI